MAITAIAVTRSVDSPGSRLLAASVYFVEGILMQHRTESWKVGSEVWEDFVRRHPELGYRPGRWPFHNFLRLHREALLAHDAIRLAKNRFWIGHVGRFSQIAFDCATGIKTARAPQSGPHEEGALVWGRAAATDSRQAAPGTTATGQDLGRSV